MTQLVQLLYVSTAVAMMDPPALGELLDQSKRHNAANDVTGLLVYSGGHFMQVIEGDQRTIVDLYAKIERDERHYRVLRLLFGPIEERAFANWSMALLNLDAPCELQLGRLRDLVRSGSTYDGGRTALSLLHEFSQQMIRQPAGSPALTV